MFRWLSGPGEVFKQPLPGSTNYLNAYDRSGNLLRARDADEGKKTGNEQNQSEPGMEVKDEGEEDEAVDQRKTSKRSKTSNEKLGLPKENSEDLMPFPMNPAFRSQAVLSEELKDAIWRRVMEEGKSVRDVSAALGVEMRRVAAVVRLKGVEKEWERQVCVSVSRLSACNNISNFEMMRKIRLVLKTYNMVIKQLQLSELFYT